jgi:hypothetical protein
MGNECRHFAHVSMMGASPVGAQIGLAWVLSLSLREYSLVGQDYPAKQSEYCRSGFSSLAARDL